MIEKKTVYREYFPGYLGHIPMKSQIIGMTVGATNNQIKSILNKEPPYEDQLIPSKLSDYTYYTKNYFCDNFSKDYNLEEDKIYSNNSKDAKTWISGSKYRIYPQHIPGYTAHLPGKKSSNIFGISYAKTTAHAIKGDYCKNIDLPASERYKSMNNIHYKTPKMRSEEEKTYLNLTDKENKLNNTVRKAFNDNNPPLASSIPKEEIKIESNVIPKCNDKLEELPDKFKEILLEKEAEKYNIDLPYIVGYKGFRRGVKSGNYYGKNFLDTSKCAKVSLLNNK